MKHFFGVYVSISVQQAFTKKTQYTTNIPGGSGRQSSRFCRRRPNHVCSIPTWLDAGHLFIHLILGNNFSRLFVPSVVGEWNSLGILLMCFVDFLSLSYTANFTSRAEQRKVGYKYVQF